MSRVFTAHSAPTASRLGSAPLKPEASFFLSFSVILSPSSRDKESLSLELRRRLQEVVSATGGWSRRGMKEEKD